MDCDGARNAAQAAGFGDLQTQQSNHVGFVAVIGKMRRALISADVEFLVPVAADRWALRAYSFLKRYAGLGDKTVQRFLKRF
jgi:hypothetical protein